MKGTGDSWKGETVVGLGMGNHVCQSHTHIATIDSGGEWSVDHPWAVGQTDRRCCEYIELARQHVSGLLWQAFYPAEDSDCGEAIAAPTLSESSWNTTLVVVACRAANA